jgi:opacity protein-like surface antigen
MFSGAAAAQEPVDWTGFYAGVMTNATTGEIVDPNNYGYPTRGALISGVVGYRLQLNNAIAGIEGQVSVGSASFFQSEQNPLYSYETELNTYPCVSLMATIGVPVGDLLPFAFAGASIGAATYHDHSGPGSAPPAPGMPILSGSDLDMQATHFDLTTGVGLDTMLTEHVILRGQYTFINTVKATYSDGESVSVDFRNSAHSLGIGLLYQF